MRIAFSQINSHLGNIDFNKQKILKEIERAKDKKASLLVFSELALIGYLPQDLLDLPQLIKKNDQALKEIHKKIPKGLTVLLGCLSVSKKERLHNSVAILEQGKKIKLCHKTLFPDYDVFDESRYFDPGKPEKNIIRVGKTKILLSICEDMWLFHPRYKKRYDNIYKNVDKSKIDLIINLSSSPYTKNKMKDRMKMIKGAQTYFKKPFLYVNMVGAQDELIFDGRSLALNKKGGVLTQSLAFKEDQNLVDFDLNEAGKRHQLSQINELENVHEALVLGVRDFIHKTGFSKVHLGLSGGIDSALVACLAVDALGPANVTAIALPTKYNASESLDLANQLAKNLGIECIEFPIQKIYSQFKEELDKKLDVKEFGLMHENLQARIRGTILMSYSNQKGSMLITTGNKSEYAVGYSTLYGDMCGGLAPIGDLLKTEVYELCRWYNKEYELIPKRIIEREPSAELRPNQTDQDSLPEYEDLDFMIENFISKHKLSKAKDFSRMIRLLFNSEFKRRQGPPILKVSDRAFGRGRRYPIAHGLSIS